VTGGDTQRRAEPPGSPKPPAAAEPARVAVLVSRFPRVTETFILREIDELERQGLPVRLVPLIREDPPVVHREAVPWVRRALYTPWLSTGILASVLRSLIRKPGRTLSTKLRLIAGTARHPSILARTLVLFPKAVHLGERLTAEGVTHLHAHFATYPATVAWVIRRLFDLPFSFTVHAHDLFVHRALLRVKVRDADFVRAISRFNRRYLEELYPQQLDPQQLYPQQLDPQQLGAGGTPISVIPMGIAPDRYGEPDKGEGSDEGESRDEGGASADPDRPTRLLCVAALEDYKGIPVLLAACEALSREGRAFVCDVVGEGSQRRALEREIERRGLAGSGSEGKRATPRVRLLGARSQEEVARRLRQTDLFVLPSVIAPSGQMEGLPVVLMEALASRLPVVATRLSGIPELVEDGVTGLLVEPGDSVALAQALRRLLDDRERDGGRLGRRLAAAGRRRVEERFDVRDTAARLAAVLAAAMERGEAGRERIAGRILHDSPDAIVSEVVGSGVAGIEVGAHPVVLKRPRHRSGQSRPPAERARWEHDVLARLHAAGVRVPRPLGCLEDADPDGEGSVLVLENVAGEPLDLWLRRKRWGGPWSFRELEAVVRVTGGWLRGLQRVTAGGRHGDLWPGNVWVAVDGAKGSVEQGVSVTVLDLEGFAEGACPHRDAACFLVTCGLYLAYPLLGRRRRRLERAFVQGWRPGGLEPAEESALERQKGREARRLLDTSAGEAALRDVGALWRRRWLWRLARASGAETGP